ncbi:MAG: energy transducer TonB [Sphingomonadaceae bacterium]|nr:energy transducer TonB [Sphingomonadaceae bacterium]
MGLALINLFKGSLFACAALLASAAHAKDRATIVLAPSSDWQVRKTDESCRVARIFGESNQKSLVYFERYEPGDQFYLLVAGNPLKASRGDPQTSFGFGPDGYQHSAYWSNGNFTGFGHALMVNQLTILPVDTPAGTGPRFDPETAGTDTDVLGQQLRPEQEAKIEWLEVRRKGNAPVRFMLGSMGEPLATLRACTDEMITRWGLDLTAHRSLTRAAAPASNPGEWMSVRDYPLQLVRDRKVGLVQFRLTVGEDGMPTGCHIQRSTRPAEFDEAVCKGLMRRARFTPALDAHGQPITSYWRSAVSFDIAGW